MCFVWLVQLCSVSVEIHDENLSSIMQVMEFI